MVSLMCQEFGAGSEGFLALLAWVKFLFAVHLTMLDEMVIFLEAFSTICTAKAPVSGVGFMVFGKEGLVCKGLPALCTRIGPLSLVDLLVDDEIRAG